MTTIEDLLRRNVTDVFDERDDGRRREAIEELYAPDATIAEANGTEVGWDGVDAVARGVLDGAAGMTFSVVSGPTVVDDLGRVGWELAPAAGGDAVVRGTDVALVRDGRIARLYTFLEPFAG